MYFYLVYTECTQIYVARKNAFSVPLGVEYEIAASETRITFRELVFLIEIREKDF